MRKILMLTVILFMLCSVAFATENGVIHWDGTTKDLGVFSITSGSIFSPYSTFKQLSVSEKSSHSGWLFTTGYSTLYSVTALILAARGWEPVVDPTLPIPKKDYYWYQAGFTIPVGVAGVGLNSLTAYGLSHAFGSDVTMAELWGPISVASVVPTFITMWVPETLIIPWREPSNTLPAQIDITRIIVGGVWSTALNIVAIKAATDLKWWQSSLIGVTSASVMATLMAVTYR